MIDIGKAGQNTGKIPVQLSHKIIELFSAGLYSSPNKAFEELVTNSYDAGASIVAVGMPFDISVDDHMWVLDDGESMDSNGLLNLWKIGESIKRESPQSSRTQIGRFGIGKLSTYILAGKLSYLCKKDGVYRAVTMDYSVLEGRKDTKPIILSERTIDETDAKEIVEQYFEVNGKNLSPFRMFGGSSKKNWTFCLMSRLLPKATEIQIGRLKWILSTALPLNPNFTLYFNGDQIHSSKVKVKIDKKWTFGRSDDVVKNNDKYTADKHKGEACVNLPSINHIRGVMTLYKESLATGKAEFMSRSHGIFLMVRGRLINLDEPLLPEMGPFAHGMFNKLRIEVHADELDEYITSTRENIKESPAFTDLKKFLTKKISEAHAYWLKQKEDNDRRFDVPYKLSQASYNLTRGPLYSVTVKFFEEGINDLHLISIPDYLNSAEKAEFLEQVEADLESEDGVIKTFSEEYVSPRLPICRLDMETRGISINMLHPYVIYCLESAQDIDAIQVFAASEVLLEAQIIEQGVNNDQRINLIKKRDETLRAISSSSKLNAATVAQKIADAENDADGLEEAVVDALNLLGFDAVPIGGKATPDGLGEAYLGDENSFKVTVDAKSTKHKKAKSTNIDLLTIDSHRKSYSANYAIVIAPNYEGGDKDDSKICKNAKTLSETITLITTKDLVRLILLAGPKQISLINIREMLVECTLPSEVSDWIDKISKKLVSQPPYREILETAWALQKNDPKEPPTASSIRQVNSNLKLISSSDIKKYVEILQHQLPNFISLDGDVISLNQSPDIIIKELSGVIKKLPPEFQKMHTKAFSINDDS